MKASAEWRLDGEAKRQRAVSPQHLRGTRQLAAAVGNQAFGRTVARQAEGPSSPGVVHPAVAGTLLQAGPFVSDAAAGTGLVQRQPTTMEFPPETVIGHVKTLDQNALGDARMEIKADMLTLRTRMRSTQIAMSEGLTNFLTDQIFAGAGEAEADFNGVFLKYAGTKILGSAIDRVGQEIPHFKPIWDLTFGLIEALDQEGERAAKAKGEVHVGRFIGDYRDNVTNGFNAKIDAVDEAERALIAEYQALAAANPTLSTPTTPRDAHPSAPPVVAGDAAEFLAKLDAIVDGWNVPKAQDCLQIIVEEWVKSSEGDLMSRGGGDMYRNGRITLSAELERDGDEWTVTKRPTSGTLVTDRADKVIKSIERVLGTGKSINDLDIQKYLTIRVDDEIPWALNDWYIVELSWRTIDDVKLESVMGHPVSAETMDKAPAIGARAIKELDVSTINVSKLSAGGGGKKLGS